MKTFRRIRQSRYCRVISRLNAVNDGDTLFAAHFAFKCVCGFFVCVRYLVYLISDTRQDKERDKHEAEYMLRENDKAMYEWACYRLWRIYLEINKGTEDLDNGSLPRQAY